jgi:hypothetical protein
MKERHRICNIVGSNHILLSCTHVAVLFSSLFRHYWYVAAGMWWCHNFNLYNEEIHDRGGLCVEFLLSVLFVSLFLCVEFLNFWKTLWNRGVNKIQKYLQTNRWDHNQWQKVAPLVGPRDVRYQGPFGRAPTDSDSLWELISKRSDSVAESDSFWFSSVNF